MSVIFETDFGSDPKGEKFTQEVGPYAGSRQALMDSGITTKFLYQGSGDEDAHLMMIDDPVGFSENGSVAMFSGGRRNQTLLQGWFGMRGLSEQRMFLNEDHRLFPAGRAYMIEEWKIRPNVQGSSFRIPLRLLTDGEGGWGWMIHAVTAERDVIDEKYWAFENWNAPVPIGMGMQKASFFEAGDPGKIKILVKPDDGGWTVVFDLSVRTDSPRVKEVRDCQEWYVQMMYGSDADFAAVASLGGVPRQYYDWWRFSIPGSEPMTEPEPNEPDEGTTMQLGTYVDESTGEWVLTWDGIESLRGADHSDLLDAEKARLESEHAELLHKINQLEADNATALNKIGQLDEAIATL